jgi:hypothetical protein
VEYGPIYSKKLVEEKNMQRTKLMQELWKKAEETKNERNSKLLEIAGNLVEATFTTERLEQAIAQATTDVLTNAVSIIAQTGEGRHKVEPVFAKETLIFANRAVSEVMAKALESA